MARPMGLLSRPAGRLSRAVTLSGRQAWRARLLLREQLVELPFVGVVVEAVVQLVARLQAVDDVLMRAFAAHGFVAAERARVYGAVGAAAVQGGVDAGIAPLAGLAQRGPAELRDVRQDRPLRRVRVAPDT